jgi:quercetin dioxygenase-like cupin family protein
VAGAPDAVNLVYDLVNLVDDLAGEKAMDRVIRAADTRRTETPNAAMTTLASPTLGDTGGLSLWLVEMSAGASGPRHVFDSEQLWTLQHGRVVVDLAGQRHELEPGDTIVLPAGAERQIHAATDARLLVCGHGRATASVPGEATPRGTPAWIA